MGTPELARASLERLLATPAFAIVGVVTQPDRPKGRDLKLAAPPVKTAALAAGKPLLQPAKARSSEFLAELAALEPDLIAVAAYGQILPPAILELPRFGCLNVHTSLLPKYRGAAPIQWAILNGESETGVTIMKMDAGLDTGPTLARTTTPILAGDDAATLHDRLAGLGADLLVRTIREWVVGALSPVPQPAEGASLAPKIKKADGLLDWGASALSLWNRVRGLAPWPGAFTVLPAPPAPRIVKVWEAKVDQTTGPAGQIIEADPGGILVGCGEASLRILTVQLEGGKRLTARQFLAGHPVRPGTVLG